jgi:hypothetical protein
MLASHEVLAAAAPAVESCFRKFRRFEVIGTLLPRSAAAVNPLAMVWRCSGAHARASPGV